MPSQQKAPGTESHGRGKEAHMNEDFCAKYKPSAEFADWNTLTEQLKGDGRKQGFGVLRVSHLCFGKVRAWWPIGLYFERT